MVELELRKQKQPLTFSELFKLKADLFFLTQLRVKLLRTPLVHSLQFSGKRDRLRDVKIDRQLCYGDLRLGQDVYAVELVGHTCLLVRWQNLNPAETLGLIDHLGDVDPFRVGKRLFQVYLEALQLGDFAFLFVFLLAQLLCNGKRMFGLGGQALAKTVVSVGDLFRALLLVLLFRLDDEHLALQRG